MKSMKFCIAIYCLFIYTLFLSPKLTKCQSLFESLNSSNQPTNRNTPNKFQTLIENLKSKISSPELKKNFTAQHVAGVFENLLTGNEFLTNLGVSDLAIFNKLEISDLLKLREMAEIEELTVKSSFKTNLLNITDDNELIFEDEAVIRIKNSPIAFKAKDIFEVIAFLKFMISVCGKQMEKCDFGNLMKNNLSQEKVDMMKVLKERFNKNKEELSQIYTEFKNKLEKDDDDANKKSAEMKKNNLKGSASNNSDHSATKAVKANEFIFKEKNVNDNVNLNIRKNSTDIKANEQSKMHQTEKEIEDLLEYEFKIFKENSLVNEYENFYNNEQFQNYLEKYYYEGM